MKFALVVLSTFYGVGVPQVEDTTLAVFESKAACEAALPDTNRALGRNHYGSSGQSSKTSAVCLPADARQFRNAE